MVRTATLLVLAGLAISGCGRVTGAVTGGSVNNTFTHDGVRYDADVAKDPENERLFTITVSPAAARPEIAQEAGRYEATKYCLKRWGGSDKEWVVGPDDPISAADVVDDTLVLTGRCTQI